MNLWNTASIVVVIAALFAFANYRWLRLPSSIGIMLVALLVSGLVIVIGGYGPGWIRSNATLLLRSVNFSETLMHGMLSFLLFAAGLNADLQGLKKQAVVVGLLATVGLLASVVIIGFAAFEVFSLLGVDVPLLYALLFGALISPTDPIAVLDTLRRSPAPAPLNAKIAGEALFNDGVGIVAFVVLLDLVTGRSTPEPASVIVLFLEEALGGILCGAAIGWGGIWLLKKVDDYSVEVLMTLAIVMGGFSIAESLHVSAPIAMVVSGLLIGDRGRRVAMSDMTRQHVDMFWKLIDELLNALLFVLIGLEVLVLDFQPSYLLAAAVLVPVILLTRFACVGSILTLLRSFRRFSPHAVKIMTWSGLRGGISVALALSVPAETPRDAILTVTYAAVVFTIVVQGLSIGPVVRGLYTPRRPS